MSVFGTNQVGEIIVGSTYGASADAVDFITNAADKDVQVFSGDGTALTAGPFKILQKADNAAAGFEFTEVIDPKQINFIKAVQYTAPINRSLKVSGFTGNVRDNVTYETWIRLYNDGGTLSPENFRMIPSFYVTPSDASGLAFTDVLNEMKINLEKSLARESNKLFTITVDTVLGELIVTAGNREFALGKKDGRPVEFSLQAAVRSNGGCNDTCVSYYDDLTVETVEPGNPGTGVGTQVANLEWCHKGEKYSRYREIAYPANFVTPYNVNPGATYNIVTIGYSKTRNYTNVEKQHRTLFLAIENTDLTAVNALIDDIEIASGIVIPALA